MKTRSKNLKLSPSSGYTLVEALITVAIVGIIAAIGAPSFVELLHTYRVRSASDALISTISVARIEAVRRALPVVIEPVTSNCDSGGNGWDCGWRSFVDANGDNAVSASDTILQTVNEPKGVTVIPNAGTTTRLTINKWGFPSRPEVIVLYPKTESNAHPSTTTVCFDRGGRLSSVKGVSASCS